MEFSVPICELLIFSCKIHPSEINLYLHGGSIAKAKEVVILGVKLKDNLSLSTHIKAGKYEIRFHPEKHADKIVSGKGASVRLIMEYGGAS